MTEAPRATARSKWVILAIAGSGVFMATLDQGIVNVALPTLSGVFQAPLVLTQWVVLGYTLCLTGLMLPVGRLSDIIGRKRIFLSGFVIFMLGSVLSGLAPSLPLLIIMSLLKGIGGAMMQANSPGLITQAFPSSERGRALGLNGAIVSAGLLSGPIVGGFIIDWLGWRWIYFVNVPIGIGAVLIGLRLLEEAPRQAEQRFDLAGAMLLPLLLTGLLLTLSGGGQLGWLTPSVMLLAVGTLLIGGLFTLVERRASQPILEVQLFHNGGFRAAILCLWLLFLGISHSQLLLPFYLQHLRGLSPSQVGLVLVSVPATMLILAPIAGLLADRFGTRLLASAGLVGVTIGLASLATLRPDSAVWEVVVRQCLLGLSTAFFQSPNSSALFGSLPRERYGVGGAYQALTRNLGQSVGQTIAAALWTAAVIAAAGGGEVEAAPVAAQMVGFQVAFLVAAVLTGIAVGISLLGRPVINAGGPGTSPASAASRSIAEG